MKLMVLDGNSVINRAYYGVRALTTRDGFFTNAIYGFLNILEKLRADEKPDALCVAFDLKAPTFRHLKYDGYKATRHPMPDELAMQMPVMKDVLRAMRIPIFECEGWEADDVIGTIGKRCGHAGWDCVIVTGDRDSLQLIDEHVTVKLVSSKLSQTVAVNYDPAKFREEYGFAPIHLIDLKALMGDSSDNIPGRRGRRPEDGDAAAAGLRHVGRRVRTSGRGQGKAACQARTGEGQRVSVLRSGDDPLRSADRVFAGSLPCTAV